MAKRRDTQAGEATGWIRTRTPRTYGSGAPRDSTPPLARRTSSSHSCADGFLPDDAGCAHPHRVPVPGDRPCRWAAARPRAPALGAGRGLRRRGVRPRCRCVDGRLVDQRVPPVGGHRIASDRRVPAPRCRDHERSRVALRERGGLPLPGWLPARGRVGAMERAPPHRAERHRDRRDELTPPCARRDARNGVRLHVDLQHGDRGDDVPHRPRDRRTVRQQ
jgi:hypothetical protein